MTGLGNLALHDRCLVVFVDDTGNEALVKVYGPGGCAAKSRDLARVIWQSCREMFGAPMGRES